jgi:hypothetical protein
MNVRRFKASLTKSGSRVIIALPFNPDDVWGTRASHYVRGSVGGCTVRGKLESAGTKFFLPLGAAWRRSSGLESGSEVTVELEPEGPQSADLSPDVTFALGAAPEAKAFFDSLATFYRKNYIRWVESAKRPETRAARIREMIESLRAGQRRTS